MDPSCRQGHRRASSGKRNRGPQEFPRRERLGDGWNDPEQSRREGAGRSRARREGIRDLPPETRLDLDRRWLDAATRLE
jgi:hypothetical protein